GPPLLLLLTLSLRNWVLLVVVRDTFVRETFVRETFVCDTLVRDTFVRDTFVRETFVRDTFERAAAWWFDAAEANVGTPTKSAAAPMTAQKADLLDIKSPSPYGPAHPDATRLGKLTPIGCSLSRTLRYGACLISPLARATTAGGAA